MTLQRMNEYTRKRVCSKSPDTRSRNKARGPGSSADAGAVADAGAGAVLDVGAGVGANPIASSYEGGKSFGRTGDEGLRALSIQGKRI